MHFKNSFRAIKADIEGHEGIFDCPSFVIPGSVEIVARNSGYDLSAEFEKSHRPEYAWNEIGTEQHGPSPGGQLGLGGMDLNLPSNPLGHYEAVRESKIVTPSDMIAVGDSYCDQFGPTLCLTWMTGYHIGDVAVRQAARLSARKRHTGVFNALFCDGHVAHAKPSKLFGQSDEELSKFNNDHIPHRDYLQPANWPKFVD